MEVLDRVELAGYCHISGQAILSQAWNKVPLALTKRNPFGGRFKIKAWAGFNPRSLDPTNETLPAQWESPDNVFLSPVQLFLRRYPQLPCFELGYMTGRRIKPPCVMPASSNAPHICRRNANFSWMKNDRVVIKAFRDWTCIFLACCIHFQRIELNSCFVWT